MRERKPKPRFGRLGHGRHERDVKPRSPLDPAFGREAVEVADELELARGVAGEPDPDVPAPPVVLPHAAEEEPGDIPVHEGDGPADPLLLPRAGDLAARVLDRGEQWLRRPMPVVPLGQEPGRRVDVPVLERPELDPPTPPSGPRPQRAP